MNTTISDSARRIYTFLVASFVIMLHFAASAFPVPLIAVWQKTLSLSTQAISATVFSYVGGCFLVLITFARLSNAWGRKNAVLISLCLGLISCFYFIHANEAAAIVAGRFFQGLACGFAASSAMSWAVDCAPTRHRWLGPTMSTSGPMIGFTVGTLLAGLGMQWHWITESALFEGLAVLLAMSILAVWFSIETVPANRPSIRSVLKPSFGLAPAARGVFPLCASGFIGTWALTCFFQGFSARIAGDVFFHGEPNAFFASITYLLLIVPNALGGLLCGRLQPQRCIVGITGLFFLAGNGIFFCPALHLPSFFFIVSLVLCGFSQGAITALSLKVLVAKTTITDRAQTISTLYLCGYIGTGIPVLMLAAAAPQASLFMIAQGFFVWFAATFSCCIFFARRAFFRAADSE